MGLERTQILSWKEGCTAAAHEQKGGSRRLPGAGMRTVVSRSSRLTAPLTWICPVKKLTYRRQTAVKGSEQTATVKPAAPSRLKHACTHHMHAQTLKMSLSSAKV